MNNDNQWYSDNNDNSENNRNTNEEPFVDYTSWDDQVDHSWRNDVYGRGNRQPNERRYQNPGKAFENASFFCGALALFAGLSSIFGAMIFAGLSITFALLSKGKQKKSSKKIKVTILMAVAGLCIGTATTTVTTIKTLQTYGSMENAAKAYMKQMDEQLGYDYFGSMYDLGDDDEDSESPANEDTTAPGAGTFYSQPQSL